MATFERGPIVVVICRPITAAEVAGLCQRVRELMEGNDADLVVDDVHGLVRPDVVTVDALARLYLTARRLGRRVRLRNASPELRELLVLVGLDEVFGSEAELRLGREG